MITYINVSSTTTTCPTAAADLMANGDCTQWRTLLLSSNLPTIAGTVTLNPVPPATDPLGLNRSTVTVRVTWTETGSSEVTAATKTVRLEQWSHLNSYGEVHSE